MSDRTLLLVKLSGRRFDVDIINAFVLTPNNSKDRINAFYSILDDALEMWRNYETNIILGDFNAKFSNHQEGFTARNYGVRERKDRGSRLSQRASHYFFNHKVSATPKEIIDRAEISDNKIKNQID